MNDLISRQDAIDAIEKVHWYHQNNNGEMVRGANSHKHQPWYKSQDVYDVLEKLPSVQSRKGKWIEIKHTFLHKCSECDWINYHDSGYNFCPNCGCRMEEGDSDEVHN